MSDIWRLGAGELAAKIAARELSAVDVMRATLARIDAVNGAVNAVVSLQDRELLMGAARVADAMAPVGPLHGVPMAVKDLVELKGIASTSGAPFLADHVPGADAGLARRLRAAGAILIGKTNVPMFGLGSHSKNPIFGVTRNPHDLSLSAGGSSGGAAVALATGMVSLADGSDAMGSLRNPAAWNDVFGFRPSFGLVPDDLDRAPIRHRLSTDGPMARSVGDLELLLGVLSDGAYQPLQDELGPPRVGWLGNWGGVYPMEAGLMDMAACALATMSDIGWQLDEMRPPFSAEALWQGWTDLRSFKVAIEKAPLWRDDATRAHLNKQIIWEIERGLSLSVEQIERAAAIQQDWLAKVDEIFELVDLLVLPATQVWPFPLDWDWPTEIAGQEMDTYHRWMEVMVPASLGGLPAICVPAGFGENSLPAGVQIIGKPGSDAQVLAWAKAYEAAIGPRAIVEMPGGAV
ncbi:MAG: amidase [Pseudomonadota bacterium]